MADDLFTLETNAQVSAQRGIYDLSRVDMSLVAFAPGLAEHVRHRQGDEFRAEEVNQVFTGKGLDTQRQAVKESRWGDAGADMFEWDPEKGSSPSSPKINGICAIINRMLGDDELHKGRDPNLGTLRKKAIICVLYPWHAYILMAFLFDQYPDKNFTYIGSCFNKTERATLMEPFNRQTTEDDDKERDQNDPIALISTYQYIAEGLNLTRCNYVITTSPLASNYFELQLFSRVVRRGQFCMTHLTVLMDDGDPTDVVTYHRSKGRTPDIVPADERRSGLRFLLGEEDDEDSMDVDSVEHETDGDDADS